MKFTTNHIILIIITPLLIILLTACGNNNDDTTYSNQNLSPQDLTITAGTTTVNQANQHLTDGNTLRSNGEFESAIEEYSDAIDLINDNPDYYLARAETYAESGLFESAISDFSTVIEMDTLPVAAYAGRGEMYYLLGDYENALADADRAIEIDPANTQAIVNRSAVFLAQQNEADALTNLNTVLSIDSEYAPAYFYRSVAHYNNGDQFDALQDLNQTIQLDSQNASAHYLRGLVYEREGGAENEELALSDYSRAIQLDPMYAAVYRARSWLYARRGEINNSQSDRTNAMLLDPRIAGVSLDDFDLEITHIWATDHASGQRPDDRDQYLVVEINVYNYSSEELCVNREDFPRLRETDEILPTQMHRVRDEFYEGMIYPPRAENDRYCLEPLSVWETFLAYDTYRDIGDITLEFSPNNTSTSLTLMLLPTDDDYAFATSAINGESVTVVGNVVITDEVRTQVLESRTAILDNCLGSSERSRTDTIEHEEEFGVEVQTSIRHTSGSGAQLESVESKRIRIRPPIPIIGDILAIDINDLVVNLGGSIGDVNVEETTTNETTRRVIHSSIAVTTTAAPGTRESTLVTWYLVNKLGYVETTINGTLYQVPFSITDTLEAEPVSLPPETCDNN